MSPFICAVWQKEAERGETFVARLQSELATGGEWRTVVEMAGCRVFGRSEKPPVARTAGPLSSLIIGDLFDADGRAAPSHLSQSASADPGAAARRLLDCYWGRYVFILRGEAGGIRGILKDPCGDADIVAWTCSDVTIIASEFPRSILHSFGPKRGLDWDAIHALAADPLFSSPTSLIMGMTAVPGGALALPTGAGFKLVQIWRPSAFARNPISDRADAAAHLRDRVDICVAAFTREPGSILAEVSGGFDSAVIASRLRAVEAPVVGWCNHYTLDPSGDERAYAQGVGELLGVEITCRPRPTPRITPELIGRSQFGIRPSVFALDPIYDEDTVMLAHALGAKRLFTGLGGDGLFYSMPMPAIARDILRRRLFGALWSSDLGDLARWCRKSVWAIARAGVTPSPRPVGLPPPRWVRPVGAETRPAVHPWLEDLSGLSPAKSEHVEEQVLALLASGSSLRGRILDLVHPLFSQPILELCLSIPADRLVQGGRDRALARRAFSGCIPAVISNRRSKGELGQYCSDAIANGLPALRDYLLGGRLMENGLLLEGEINAALHEGYFAQHGGFSSLLFTVAIEAWVRRWAGAASAKPF